MDLNVNGRRRAVAPEWQSESLLDVLREHFGLTGTKFGCGVGLCGACTVLLDGSAVRSCITAAADAQGGEIVTIEGLGSAERPHPLQQAWLDRAVPQCGYCQAGQIMAAAALLQASPAAGVAEIDAAMQGNLCRCGTYNRIRAAILQASGAR